MVLRNSVRLIYRRSRVQFLVRGVELFFSLLLLFLISFLPLSCFRPHFLNFYKSKKLSQASEYFSKYLQTLQVFLKLVNIFLEFLQVLKNPPSFRIFFQVFTNTPGLPEVGEHFSRISTSPRKYPKL